MIDRLIAHIGPFKTGTTAVQQTLHAHAAALEESGVCYPTVGGGDRADHAEVAREFMSRDQPSGPGPAWGQFVDAVTRSKAQTAFLSSEMLAPLYGPRLSGAMEAWSNFAEHIDVLVYARHPVHFANSAVSTRIRIGRTLADLIEEPPQQHLVRIIRRWYRAVDACKSSARLIVRYYGRDFDPTFNIVDDVLTATGLDASQIASSKRGRTLNAGLSTLAVYCLDWANRNGLQDATQPGLAAALSAMKGPPYVLPESTRDRIRADTAVLTKQLSDEFGVTLKERPEPSTPCPLSPEELASLAQLLVGSTQFAFEVHESRFGRWLGLNAPAMKRRHHPVRNALNAIGLVDPFLGPHGRRARDLHRRMDAVTNVYHQGEASRDIQPQPPGSTRPNKKG